MGFCPIELRIDEKRDPLFPFEGLFRFRGSIIANDL